MNNNEEQPQINTPETLFDHWRIVLGYKRAKLDEKRRKLIAARLNDGYSFEDLMDAISGCFLSAFHQGENADRRRYDDIGLILRDAEHVDKFVALYDDAQVIFARKQIKLIPVEINASTAETARAKLEQMRRLLK